MDPLTLGIMAGVSGAGQIGSGLIGGYYADKAAKRQMAAADKAKGAITDSYNTAQGYQQPYLQAGNVGLDRMMNTNYDVATPGIYQSAEQQPTYRADQFNFQKDPGYDFQMQQGQNAVLGSAAGRGAGLSGATLKALTKYGTGLANQSYGDSFDRYMRGRQENASDYRTNLGQYNINRGFGADQLQQDYMNRNQQAVQGYGRASDLGQIGYGAAGNLSNMATGYGDSIASLYGQRGNAEAAGLMGKGQGFSNALGGLSSAASLYALGQGGTKSYNKDPYGLNELPF